MLALHGKPATSFPHLCTLWGPACCTPLSACVMLCTAAVAHIRPGPEQQPTAASVTQCCMLHSTWLSHALHRRGSQQGSITLPASPCSAARTPCACPPQAPSQWTSESAPPPELNKPPSSHSRSLIARMTPTHRDHEHDGLQSSPQIRRVLGTATVKAGVAHHQTPQRQTAPPSRPAMPGTSLWPCPTSGQMLAPKDRGAAAGAAGTGLPSERVLQGYVLSPCGSCECSAGLQSPGHGLLTLAQHAEGAALAQLPANVCVAWSCCGWSLTTGRPSVRCGSTP